MHPERSVFSLPAVAAFHPDLARLARAGEEAPGESTAPAMARHRILVGRGDDARKYKPIAEPMPLSGRSGEPIGLVTAVEVLTGPGGEPQAWATVETTEPLDPQASMRFTFTEATGPKYPGQGNRRERRGDAAARRRGR